MKESRARLRNRFRWREQGDLADIAINFERCAELESDRGECRSGIATVGIARSGRDPVPCREDHADGIVG